MCSTACSPDKSTIDKIYCQWEKSNNANGQVAHLNYKSRLIVGYLAIISILSSEAKIKSKKKKLFYRVKLAAYEQLKPQVFSSGLLSLRVEQI